MSNPEQLQRYVSDAETLLEKLHEHWGGCLWIDAGELIALERLIELAKESKQ